MKRHISRYGWTAWRALFERGMRIDASRAIIVLGFPRSGTSAVSRLVHAAGVSFGDMNRMRPSDHRNPEGFLERRDVNGVDASLLWEAGHKSALAYDMTHELRAYGFFNRVRRLFTRRRMLRVLSDLSRTQGLWGMKSFPLQFHIWNQYLPKARIVAVYRDPVTNAASLVETFKRVTFTQALNEWTNHNQELLYHLSRHEHVLVSQEALQNSETRRAEVEKIVGFLGCGDVDALSAMMENKQPRRAPALMQDELPAQTRRVWEALERAHRA
ncbi:MAG: sulfotransferase [Minisyncoccia bacterium]